MFKGLLNGELRKVCFLARGGTRDGTAAKLAKMLTNNTQGWLINLNILAKAANAAV